MATALGRKCQVCRTKAAQVVVPSEKEPVRPVYACEDCSLKFPNIFYEGPPIFHFRSENGQWYFVFVHHDHLVPYFYPSPELQITTERGGKILWKKVRPGQHRERGEPVCERIVPYKLATREAKGKSGTLPHRIKQGRSDL